ncbi:hypothetical protein, partial [Escherichia coli]|uniref:hypothetical protein n=1 Tax=Escherichia coli TaxID=562 RepID=UPI00201020F8
KPLIINGKPVYKYRGNMLKAGVYDYPEKGTTAHYTKDDINRLTERPLKTGYITKEHLLSQPEIALGNEMGWFEIVGYDADQGADVTDFYVYS